MRRGRGQQHYRRGSIEPLNWIGGRLGVERRRADLSLPDHGSSPRAVDVGPRMRSLRSSGANVNELSCRRQVPVTRGGLAPFAQPFVLSALPSDGDSPDVEATMRFATTGMASPAAADCIRNERYACRASTRSSVISTPIAV